MDVYKPKRQRRKAARRARQQAAKKARLAVVARWLGGKR